MNREEYLKELIESKFGNVKAFSEVVDVPYTTIRTMLKNGIGKAGVDNVIKICKALNISPDVLSSDISFSEHLNSTIDIINKLDDDRQKNVYTFAKKQLEEQNSNVIDMRKWKDVYVQSKVSAGTGVLDLEQEHKELISYNGYVPNKYDLAFEVNGDSMEPIFRDKEIIFVKREKDVRNGQLGVVLVNDEAYIKKMYVEDDKLRLVSLNKKYEDIIANGDDKIEVVGRVIL